MANKASGEVKQCCVAVAPGVRCANPSAGLKSRRCVEHRGKGAGFHLTDTQKGVLRALVLGHPWPAVSVNRRINSLQALKEKSLVRIYSDGSWSATDWGRDHVSGFR